jgi:hypothetical protein
MVVCALSLWTWGRIWSQEPGLVRNRPPGPTPFEYYGFRKPTSIADAVAEFNKVVKERDETGVKQPDETDAKQPPVTEGEIIGAARVGLLFQDPKLVPVLEPVINFS